MHSGTIECTLLNCHRTCPSFAQLNWRMFNRFDLKAMALPGFESRGVVSCQLLRDFNHGNTIRSPQGGLIEIPLHCIIEGRGMCGPRERQLEELLNDVPSCMVKTLNSGAVNADVGAVKKRHCRRCGMVKMFNSGRQR